MRSNRTKTDRLKLVWAKTKGVCAHCGNPSSGRGRTIDHYVPRSYDGGYDIRNLMPLCRKCNAARGNEPIDPFEFYKYAPEEYIRQCIEYEDEHKANVAISVVIYSYDLNASPILTHTNSMVSADGR